MGKTWQYESLMKYVQTCTRETKYEYKFVESPLVKVHPSCYIKELTLQRKRM